MVVLTFKDGGSSEKKSAVIQSSSSLATDKNSLNTKGTKRRLVPHNLLLSSGKFSPLSPSIRSFSTSSTLSMDNYNSDDSGIEDVEPDSPRNVSTHPTSQPSREPDQSAPNPPMVGSSRGPEQSAPNRSVVGWEIASRDYVTPENETNKAKVSRHIEAIHALRSTGSFQS